MINTEDLKLLATSDSGKVLIDWLDDQIKQLGDITKLDKDNVDGKREAVIILKELFSFLERTREKQPNIQKTNYL